MTTIVITGPIGAGKSAVLATFASLGWETHSADEIVRNLQQPDGRAFGPISMAFPDAIKEGQLDRAELAAIVFGDPDSRIALEQIVHPLVHEEIQKLIADNAPLLAIEIPLVSTQSPYMGQIDTVVAVIPDEAWLERKAGASGISVERLRSRRNTQPTDSEYRALADKVIENTGTLLDLERRVSEVHLELTT